MTENNSLRIREATEQDVPLIVELIREHAEYERALDRFTATEEILRITLFGPRPHAEAVVAYLGEEPAGFAMYYFSCSSYTGLPNLFLEDIFVQPAHRGSGVGKQLFAFLARRASERGCGRIEWCVLDWNETAIGFYQKLGAKPVRDWIVFQMDEDVMDELTKLA